jgi:hypothetical protein
MGDGAGTADRASTGGDMAGTAMDSRSIRRV